MFSNHKVIVGGFARLQEWLMGQSTTSQPILSSLHFPRHSSIHSTTHHHRRLLILYDLHIRIWTHLQYITYCARKRNATEVILANFVHIKFNRSKTIRNYSTFTFTATKVQINIFSTGRNKMHQSSLLTLPHSHRSDDRWQITATCVLKQHGLHCWQMHLSWGPTLQYLGEIFRCDILTRLFVTIPF